MPFVAALSTAAESPEALREVCEQTRARLEGGSDLAVLFFSPHHLEAAGLLGRMVREQLAPRCLLGCVGEAIIGPGREVEGGPALSLWVGRWSRPVQVVPFHLV